MRYILNLNLSALLIINRYSSLNMPPKKRPADPLDSPAAATTADTPALKKKRLRAENAKWSKDDVVSMISQLQDAKVNGNTSDNGFKMSVWNSIGDSFDDPLKVGRVCQTKFSSLKGQYKEVKFLRELSGFGTLYCLCASLEPLCKLSHRNICSNGV